MLFCNISKNYTSFGFGDETLLIVTFKPIDSRLIYCNERSVESEELSNCV